MKHKELAALLLIGALLSGIVTAAGIGADNDTSTNTLISLEWLQNTFLPGVRSDLQEQIDSGFDQVLGNLEQTGVEGVELRVKSGDMITLEVGASLTPLAGDFSVSASGAVLDITVGEELAQDSANLLTDHRYLVSDGTQALFCVVSDTAVVRINGAYRLTLSRETDYNLLADALYDMSLFYGTDTPYGSGYDLEKEPNRVQGLIMFLRLLGEEDAALSFTDDSIVFTDVPKWARPYVGYAYSKGYTKGQEVNANGEITFGSSNTLRAIDFVTFILRAMEYEEGVDFAWKTVLTDALELGLLTEGEALQLEEKPFLRAQVVYLSYFALSAQTASGNTLLERVASGGKISESEIRTILELNSVERL